MMAIGPQIELEVACRGDIDPQTGYLLNISRIDQAVRSQAIPIVSDLMRRKAVHQPASLLAMMLDALQPHVSGMVSWLRLHLTPYHAWTMNAEQPDRACISQQFEFSASHRLHIDSLSAQQNREYFGKCNNLNGHGHNYRLEPQVSVPVDPPADQPPFSLGDLERIVHELIIQRFDHKHLNLDTTEFARLNPTVENIARICHQLLVEPVRTAGGTLERVTVWETEKTRCTYPA